MRAILFNIPYIVQASTRHILRFFACAVVVVRSSIRSNARAKVPISNQTFRVVNGHVDYGDNFFNVSKLEIN